jgi:cytosine/adenosine deaminase-related metal-dependent hydrolase
VILGGVEVVGDDAPARDLVVSGATLERVLPKGEADARRYGPRLDLEGMIAFPGLVNSHDHLEFNLYPPLGHRKYADYVEWGGDIHRQDRELIASVERVPRHIRFRWGALKNLLSGVTAVVHHGEEADVPRDLSVDVVHATSIHSVRQGHGWRRRLNALIDRSPYVAHVGEGTSPDAHREVDTLLRWNLLRRSLIGVHAMAVRPDQAAYFRALVWCPVSNELLYGRTADVGTLREQTTILFGTDSTLTGDWNIWHHLRRARSLGPLDDRRLFDAVTKDASLVWGEAGRGVIADGRSADIVVARKTRERRWDAFFAVEPEDIALVLKRGLPVLSDMSLDVPAPPGQWSRVRVGERVKRVADDVPGLVSRIRSYGVAENLPIASARLEGASLEAVALP